MLIPRGTYMLGPIVLKGPCKGQVEIQIIGTLKALTNKVSTINVNHWITFQYIDRLVLRGGGKLDGQGASAWDDNTCSKNPNCKALPFSTNPSWIGLKNGVAHDHVLGPFVMSHSWFSFLRCFHPLDYVHNSIN